MAESVPSASSTSTATASTPATWCHTFPLPCPSRSVRRRQRQSPRPVSEPHRKLRAQRPAVRSQGARPGSPPSTPAPSLLVSRATPFIPLLPHPSATHPARQPSFLFCVVLRLSHGMRLRLLVPEALAIRVSAVAQQEEEEDAVDIDLSLDRLDSVSEPLHTAANISDVKWLPKDALLRGSVVLHLNGTDQTYKISNNETDPVPPQVCQLSGVVPSQGVCRHFSHCVLGQVVQRIEDFVKYQCTIGDYLAICCPSDVAPTSQPASQPPV